MVEIIGQDRALSIVHTALRGGRFHHAWIFHGPRGVGKRTTAVEVARLLLADTMREGPNGLLTTDPASDANRLIDAGTHPDLHLIYKELALYSDVRDLRTRKLMNIPIDLLRERIFGGRTSDDKIHDGPAYRTAMMGKAKVFIIDEAELLNEDGQFAFLKTLEEPPPRTYFFLVTSRPEALLPTIRSRCQPVAFSPLNDADMKSWARSMQQKGGGDGEGRGTIDDWTLEHADGSPGMALLAQEYGFHRWFQTIEPMLLAIERGGYAVTLGEALGKCAEEFAETWVKKHKNASKDAANKDGTRHVLGLLARHARTRLAAARTDTDRERWLSLIHLLRAAERQLESNVSYKAVMESTMAQWATGEPSILALVE